MKNCEIILAAIDFSRHSKLVVDHAISLASQLNAELVFVNVINQRDVLAIETAINKIHAQGDFKDVTSQGYVDGLTREREKEFKTLMEPIDSKGVNIRFAIRIGVPFKELLSAIPDENADLVIIGVKGRTDLVDVLVGSNALKMFRRCPVPLITVREH